MATIGSHRKTALQDIKTPAPLILGQESGSEMDPVERSETRRDLCEDVEVGLPPPTKRPKQPKKEEKQ